jgi:hypothetical protein
MKIVQGDELQWERGLEHRGGMFHFRRLMEGEPGGLDNFQLSLGRMSGEFYSPRHRHNFEQVRFQLDGALDFARDGKMTKGMVGYFPEGMFYGPQTQDPDTTPMTVVLQCGGASGSGYLCRDEVKAGMDALKSQGEFKDGVFRRHQDAPGKRNLDGYQAIWEFVNKRPMVYPKPRYSRPFMMDAAHYEWVPVTGSPGAAEKLLGVFTERRTQASFLRLEAGAGYYASGRAIFFVLDGAGEIAGQEFRRLTTILLERGERATFSAREGAQMLRLGLPDLSGLRAQGSADVTAVAAE